jgi:hypothetical protein
MIKVPPKKGDGPRTTSGKPKRALIALFSKVFWYRASCASMTTRSQYGTTQLHLPAWTRQRRPYICRREKVDPEEVGREAGTEDGEEGRTKRIGVEGICRRGSMASKN